MDKSSEKWRNECEARELLKWPLAERRKQLDLVEQKRGWQARLELQDEMRNQWQTKKLIPIEQSSSSTNSQPSLPKQKQIELI